MDKPIDIANLAEMNTASCSVGKGPSSTCGSLRAACMKSSREIGKSLFQQPKGPVRRAEL